jgi:glutaconyl-CoA/methylmalonyl-CoA decarboxylase subunit gamma
VRFTAEVGGQRVPVEVRREGGQYVVTVGARRFTLDVCRTGAGSLSVIEGGRSHDIGLEKTSAGYDVRMRGLRIPVALVEGAGAALSPAAASGPSRVAAPMPGKIVSVAVSPGQDVEPGAPLVVMEAMKMQNEIQARRRGRVSRVLVQPGQAVDGGATLIELV